MLSLGQVLSDAELSQFLGMADRPQHLALLASAVTKLMKRDRDDLREETTQTDLEAHGMLCEF